MCRQTHRVFCSAGGMLSHRRGPGDQDRNRQGQQPGQLLLQGNNRIFCGSCETSHNAKTDWAGNRNRTWFTMYQRQQGGRKNQKAHSVGSNTAKWEGSSQYQLLRKNSLYSKGQKEQFRLQSESTWLYPKRTQHPHAIFKSKVVWKGKNTARVVMLLPCGMASNILVSPKGFQSYVCLHRGAVRTYRCHLIP